PFSSRRNQSTTVSTSEPFPLNVTRIAFRTFAAASAAIRFSNTAAYGFFDIHQMTRNIGLPGERGSCLRFIAVRILLPLTGWASSEEAAGRGQGRCQRVEVELTNTSTSRVPTVPEQQEDLSIYRLAMLGMCSSYVGLV